MTNTILNTTDYTQFKVNPNQPKRKANTALVSSIVKSNGNIQIAVITEDGIIVDGHRRLSACQQGGVPFYYYIVDNSRLEGIKAIKDLNVNVESWSMKKYIESYAKTNSDYKQLQDFISDFKVPISFFASLSKFNEAQFKAEVSLSSMDWKLMEHRAGVYRQLCALFPEIKTNEVHRSLRDLYAIERFSETRLLEQLAHLIENGNSLGVVRNKRQFLIDLCNIHDNGLRIKVLPELVAKNIIKVV